MNGNSFNIQTFSTMKRKEKSNAGDTFSARLISLRKARGLTQKDLADQIGTSQRMISYYENNAQYPPAALLPSIAKILRISIDELLGLKSLKEEMPPKNTRLWKKLRIIDRLPAQDQRAVVHYVEALIAKQSTQ